jgi:hypothetical protein
MTSVGHHATLAKSAELNELIAGSQSPHAAAIMAVIAAAVTNGNGSGSGSGSNASAGSSALASTALASINASGNTSQMSNSFPYNIECTTATGSSASNGLDDEVCTNEITTTAAEAKAESKGESKSEIAITGASCDDLEAVKSSTTSGDTTDSLRKHSGNELSSSALPLAESLSIDEANTVDNCNYSTPPLSSSSSASSSLTNTPNGTALNSSAGNCCISSKKRGGLSDVISKLKKQQQSTSGRSRGHTVGRAQASVPGSNLNSDEMDDENDTEETDKENAASSCDPDSDALSNEEQPTGVNRSAPSKTANRKLDAAGAAGNAGLSLADASSTASSGISTLETISNASNSNSGSTSGIGGGADLGHSISAAEQLYAIINMAASQSVTPLLSQYAAAAANRNKSLNSNSSSNSNTINNSNIKNNNNTNGNVSNLLMTSSSSTEPPRPSRASEAINTQTDLCRLLERANLLQYLNSFIEKGKLYPSLNLT